MSSYQRSAAASQDDITPTICPAAALSSLGASGAAHQSSQGALNKYSISPGNNTLPGAAPTQASCENEDRDDKPDDGRQLPLSLLCEDGVK
jgi:hypothetical protein